MTLLLNLKLGLNKDADSLYLGRGEVCVVWGLTMRGEEGGEWRRHHGVGKSRKHGHED